MNIGEVRLSKKVFKKLHLKLHLFCHVSFIDSYVALRNSVVDSSIRFKIARRAYYVLDERSMCLRLLTAFETSLTAT